MADFSSLTKQQMALRDSLNELEKESARQRDAATSAAAKGKVKGITKDTKMAAETANKASEVRAELSSVQLKRDKKEADLDEAQRQLKAKQGQLNSRKVTFAE